MCKALDQQLHVSVYQWALPEDIGSLQRAIQEIAAATIDVLLITSANQVNNLMEVATQSDLDEAMRRGLRHEGRAQRGRWNGDCPFVAVSRQSGRRFLTNCR